MANVRIKDLTTTAATTASDDFFGVDGATNGTRKLNAFSPTFGGNLTVSGTGTSSFSGDVSILSNSKALFLGASSDVKLVRGGSGAGTLQLSAASDGYAEMSLRGAAGSLRITSVQTGANFRWYWGANTTAESGSNTGSDFVLVAGTDIGTTLGTAITVNRATLATTLGGNLTVSGSSSANVNIAAFRSNYTGGASTPYISIFGFQDETTGARIVGDVNGAADNGVGLKIQTRTNAGVLQDVISFPKNTNNTTISGNLTVSGGTVTSGTGTLTLNSSANTVVLQSAGTTALTLDSSQNATFAKNVTASGGTALFQATNANSIVHIKVNSDTYNPYIRLEQYNRSIYVGVKDAGADGTFNISTAAALTSPMLSLDPATNGATFAGAIAIGNTVQTAAAVASTHKVTISIGGVTYYLLATNV